MKRRLVLLASFIFVVVVVFVGKRIFELENRKACARVLRHLSDAVQLFKELHGGHLPRTFEDIVPDNTASACTCPVLAHAGKTGGYVIYDWTLRFRTETEIPPKFPLVSDDTIQNHKGRGINVLFVDGTVSWDPDGQRLNQVLKDYPVMQPESRKN